jgi:hypothetical protein
MGFLVLGALVAVGAIFKLIQLKKYKFDDRTGDGVIGFQSYWAAKGHDFTKVLCGVLIIVGLILMIAAYGRSAGWPG